MHTTIAWQEVVVQETVAMNRREALEALAAFTLSKFANKESAGPRQRAAGGGGPTAQAAAGGMIYRTLGRTGEKISAAITSANRMIRQKRFGSSAARSIAASPSWITAGTITTARASGEWDGRSATAIENASS